MNTYVGPTISANKSYRKEVNVRSCMNEGCSNYGAFNNGNFCSKCGSRVDLIKKTEIHDVDLRDILSDMNPDYEDFLVKPEYMNVWIPQQIPEGEFMDTEGGTYDLTNIEPRHSIMALMNTPEIIGLVDYCEFAKIKLDFKFEVVTYWS